MAEAGYGGAQQGAADAGGNRATVLAVAGLMLALFLVALDQTIVGTALPQIVADLEGFERYAWVTTAYLLASTAMIPVIGKLGDIYGRKWFILGGIFVFLAGSALCGAAWGMIELIIFRGIQGLGAGMIFANIFTSVADIFPDPARRAKYQGVFFSVFALSSVVGPAMGGWITDNLDWRWVFYVNLPLGLFSLFALPFVLPQSGRRRGARIDFPGAITSPPPSSRCCSRSRGSVRATPGTRHASCGASPSPPCCSRSSCHLSSAPPSRCCRSRSSRGGCSRPGRR